MIRARKENCRELVKLRNEIYLAWMSREDDFLKKQHLRGKRGRVLQADESCMQRPGGRREQGSVTDPKEGLAQLACVGRGGGWAGAGMSPCKTSSCLFSCNRALEGASHSILTMPLAKKKFHYVCFTYKEAET